MSNRGEILDSSRFGSENGIRHGLLYSGVLGWLDMGHARGDDVRKLMAQFSTVKLAANLITGCVMNKLWGSAGLLQVALMSGR